MVPALAGATHPDDLPVKDALVVARWMLRRPSPAGRKGSEMTLPQPTSAKPTMTRDLPKDVADPAKLIRKKRCLHEVGRVLPKWLDATERNL